MCEPSYQEFDVIQRIGENGVFVRIVVGEVFGGKGAVDCGMEIEFMDFEVRKGGSFWKKLGKGFNGFFYVYEGRLGVGDQVFEKNSAGFFGVEEIEREVFFEGREDSKFLWVSGVPIGEKVVQYGPFVMNSQEEIYQAFEDFENCKNGFESYKNWKSSIKDLAKKKF